MGELHRESTKRTHDARRCYNFLLHPRSPRTWWRMLQRAGSCSLTGSNIHTRTSRTKLMEQIYIFREKKRKEKERRPNQCVSFRWDCDIYRSFNRERMLAGVQRRAHGTTTNPLGQDMSQSASEFFFLFFSFFFSSASHDGGGPTNIEQDRFGWGRHDDVGWCLSVWLAVSRSLCDDGGGGRSRTGERQEKRTGCWAVGDGWGWYW